LLALAQIASALAAKEGVFEPPPHAASSSATPPIVAV